jgi:ResB-like family
MSRVIKFLSSLKLTVVLLSLGLVLIFIGTLAQVHEGLYNAQARFFKSWIVVGATLFGTKMPWLILPGGYAIGSALFASLVTAHFTRFKWTWRRSGIFMTHLGVILLLLGQLGTDMLSTESSMRLEEGETRNYSEDFHVNELAFVNQSLPNDFEVVAIPETHLAAKGEIQHPSLPFTVKIREHWPNAVLMNIPPFGSVPVPATDGVFTNYSVAAVIAENANRETRAAVWFEVLGSNGVTATLLVAAPLRGERETERSTFMHAGKTFTASLLFAPAMGGNMLAIGADADRASRPAMIPEADLKGEITREELPFKLRIRQFWPRAELHEQLPANAVLRPATHGKMSKAAVVPQPLVTDMSGRNLPAAVVEVIAGGKSLGLWLTSARHNKLQQEFEVDGKSYEVSLRFKRFYKPYSLTLLDFTHERYPGTELPKDFRSRVRIDHPAKAERRETEIFMNNPLRYEGLTYYQASFEPGDTVTVFQIVKNPNWLTPYLACLLVGLGLTVQFLIHLVEFARKRATPAPVAAAVAKGKKSQPQNGAEGAKK